MKSELNEWMDNGLSEKVKLPVRDLLDGLPIPLCREEFPAKRFRTLIENSVDAIVLIDKIGTIRYESPAYAQMMGRIEYERVGNTIIEFVHPDDHVIYHKILGKILKNPGLPIKFNIRNQHTSGAWRRLGCVANNMLEEPGIQSIIINIHDITEQWNAEEALRKSEGLYADLILNQVAGVYRIHVKRPSPGQPIWEDFTHEFICDRFLTIMGIDKSDVCRISASLIFDLIHPDDRKDFILSNIEANLKLTPFAWEGRIVNNNITKWVRFDSNPRKLDDGSIRWTGIVIDITKQKLIEELFKKNSDRLMKLNDCLSSLGPDSIININRLTALCGELLYATFALYNRLENGRLHTLGKWQVPEGYHANGDICYDVIRNNSENTLIINNLPETTYAKTDPNALVFGIQTYCGQVVRSEGIAIGTLCTLYNSEYIFTDEDRKIIGIIASAIGNEDNRKVRNEALMASESKLMELNSTKDKFFSIIAHDLKGPFNGIIGFSEILKDEAEHLDTSTIVDYAETIHSAALQTHRLLDNLLKWARMQEGRIFCKPVSNSMHSIVNEVFLLFTDISDRKEITLNNMVPSAFIVIADTEMLKTILRNLISNALKYTQKNGNVWVSASINDSNVEIVVADDGGGIKADDLCKLFRIDVVFSTEGTEKEKGTGLGLVLCKEFIEKHGGNISVESELGKGSKFKFTFPFQYN